MNVSGADNRLNIAVLSLSAATRYDRDCCSARLARRLRQAGHSLSALVRVPETGDRIENQVQTWIDGRTVDVVMTVNDDTPGTMPPLIVMTAGEVEQPQFTRLMRDRELGYVSVINLRSARPPVELP